MWHSKKKDNKIQFNTGRLRLVVAVIFLLSFAIMYRLFIVQIRECDKYTARASSQYDIDVQLKPKRGNIFFSTKLNDKEKIYSFASKRNFVVVNIVPKDVKDPEGMAEKLYEFFDQDKIEAEVDKEIKDRPENDKDKLDLVRKNLIDKKKNELLAKYLKKTNKPHDPYEPLNNRMESEELLKLYAKVVSTDDKEINWQDLQLKNGKIIAKDGTSIEIPGLHFILQEYRYYPEKELGSHLLGFVSNIGTKEIGHYGLEGFFDEELSGKMGKLKSERGGKSNVIIVNNRKYIPPINGSDLILTIDRNIEFKACEELRKGVEKYNADEGDVVIVNPKTGAIIAMCSWPSFDPNNYKDVDDIELYNNPVTFYQYEPGSVFKTITLAIAINEGKISPDTLYDDKGEIIIHGWPKAIKNADFFTHGPHGLVDMNTVLEKSLNTGAIFAMTKVGPKVFADYIQKFGFGEKTGIELGSESSGDISNLLHRRIKAIDAATASFGQGIAVTPLQMVMAYQAIANGGILMKPYVVKEIIRDGNKKEEISPKQIGRVVSNKTANMVSAMLVNVVEKGHAKGAKIPGYYVGGKTGTAQVAISGGYSHDKYIHTFIGMAPIDKPVFVMLLKLNNPKGVKYAVSSVVPIWHNIADFILKYYHIPKSR